MDIQKQIQDLNERLKNLERAEFTHSHAPANYTPTEAGWAGGATFDCNYVKVGKLVHLWYMIEGTSDAAAHTITLPDGGTIAHDTTNVYFYHRGKEGAGRNQGMTTCNTGATVLDFYKDEAAAEYAATGTLHLYGYVCYWEL